MRAWRVSICYTTKFCSLDAMEDGLFHKEWYKDNQIVQIQAHYLICRNQNNNRESEKNHHSLQQEQGFRLLSV